MLYRDYLKDKYQSTALKTAYADGVPCVLESSKGKNIRNYEVYGNSVQDGTPTPEIPVEIQSVGDLVTDTESEHYGKYNIPITVRGKNLLPYPYIYTTKTINGVTFTDNGDGSITIDGTATANAVFYLVGKQDNYTLDKCGLKIGDSYTISKNLVSGDSIANVYFTANYYNTSGTMKEGSVVSSANTAAATIKSDFKSWGIYLLVLKDKTVNNTTIKPQLEKGSSATEYEPYKGRITEHIYLDEPLRKVDDYSDYIDFKGQRVVRKVVVSDNTGTKPISESLGVLAIPTEEPIALPALKTFKGTSIISVDTSVQPSNIKAKYVRL